MTSSKSMKRVLTAAAICLVVGAPVLVISGRGSRPLQLMQEDAVPSVFFLSGGPQGMFDIEDSSSVRSHGRPEDPAAVETKGKNRESFLRDVRQQARKWPKPGKCCG